jgi:hypothetical protein
MSANHKLIEFEEKCAGYGSVLRCPACKGDYLHQVDSREEMKPDPYFPRGGSIVIGFYCEACPAHPRLFIGQHKGRTFIGWDGASLIPQPGPATPPWPDNFPAFITGITAGMNSGAIDQARISGVLAQFKVESIFSVRSKPELMPAIAKAFGLEMAYVPLSGAPAIPTPLPPVERVLTEKARGQTYESFVSYGWTDDALIEAGFMTLKVPMLRAGLPPTAVAPSPGFLAPPLKV